MLPENWWNMSWDERRTFMYPVGTYTFPSKRCMTEHGLGTIVCCEADSTNKNFLRYGVKLDNNPFSYPIAFYMHGKISIID